MKALVYYRYSEVASYAPLAYIDLDSQDILDSMPKSLYYNGEDCWDYLSDIAKAHIESLKVVPYVKCGWDKTIVEYHSPENFDIHVYYKVVILPYYDENDGSGTITGTIDKINKGYDNLISSLYKEYGINRDNINEALEKAKEEAAKLKEAVCTGVNNFINSFKDPRK